MSTADTYTPEPALGLAAAEAAADTAALAHIEAGDTAAHLAEAAADARAIAEDMAEEPGQYAPEDIADAAAAAALLAEEAEIAAYAADEADDTATEAGLVLLAALDAARMAA